MKKENHDYLKFFIDQDFEFEDHQKVYWTKVQEDAIVEYLWLDKEFFHNKIGWEIEEAEEDQREPDKALIDTYNQLADECDLPENIRKKDKIFNEKIYKALCRLVENIVFKYTLIRPDIDVKTLQTDALSFVITKIAKFKPSKNKKSYSYYGTMIKHYLIGEKTNQDKNQTSNLHFENHKDEVNSLKNYDITKEHHLDTSMRFFNFVIDEIRKELDKDDLTESQRKVGNAILYIFKRHEDFFDPDSSYNKTILYQLIKEYTNLESKDITYSLSRFKIIYRMLKDEFKKKNN